MPLQSFSLSSQTALVSSIDEKPVINFNWDYRLQFITMPLTGHCLCKAVTYSVDMEAPLLVGYDHCDDCQRQSGSTYCTSPTTVLTPKSRPVWDETFERKQITDP